MFNSKSNFAVGMKVSTIIILGALSLILMTMALPIILPVLWLIVIIAAGVGSIIGLICLLGWVVNLFKRK